MKQVFHPEPPGGERRVLLHTCCAPCSGSVVEDLHEAGLAVTIYFYNPNIHPRAEYEIRKAEMIRYAAEKGIPFVDADYDPERWFLRMKGRENDPERGERCGICFEMRFAKTAAYAFRNGFKVMASCAGISRWKDFEQVSAAGVRAASLFPGVTYWTYNWRRNSGSGRMYEIAKTERFYKQEYCGCAYSLRDANERRIVTGKRKIGPRSRYGSEASFKSQTEYGSLLPTNLRIIDSRCREANTTPVRMSAPTASSTSEFGHLSASTTS